MLCRLEPLQPFGDALAGVRHADKFERVNSARIQTRGTPRLTKVVEEKE
jgi:hypothetical protein